MLRNLLRVGLSIGISCLILALLLNLVTTGISDESRPSVISALQNTALTLVVTYLVLYLIALVLRAWRYLLLLRLAGEQQLPSMPQMLIVTGIRNMIVDLLPARLGELGYVALLNRGYGVKLQHCVSSLTVAIAFDLLALFVIIIFVLAVQMFGAGVEGWAIGALLSAFIISTIALSGLFYLVPLVAAYLNGRSQAKETWFGRAVQLFEQFSISLQSVRDSGGLLIVLTLSMGIRVLKYFGMYLLFVAVTRASFPELASLPATSVLWALLGGEIAASLPIPAFMSFGVYEAGGTLVFHLLQVVDQAAAVVTMFSVHIWSQLMEYVLGGILLLVFIYARSQKQHAKSGSIKATRMRIAYTVFGSGLLVGVGMFVLAYQLWASSKLGAFSAPSVGAVADNIDEWQRNSKAHVAKLKGFVVFSSNRGGNHDIYQLDLADFKINRLTTHPHTETYPRISPDGKRVAFSRAHQPWVSQRNVVAWDVWVLELESGKEWLVGKNSTSPHWIGNDEITYIQNANRVYRHNLGSNEANIIFQTGLGNSMPKGVHVYNPRWNPVSGELVFTARQSHIGMNTGHWGTAINKGDSHRGVLNGCELTWANGGKNLYQIAGGGRDGDLRIVEVDPKSLAIETLIDLEGEFSHEYWPKDSHNGEYVVFGASRSPQEHEHDTEDYEIFLWKRGSDAAQATRLTFHTGNDNWPDIYIE